MPTIKAKDFKNRVDLENEVRNKVGLTSEIKSDWIIEGKRDELALLRLSDRSVFWGIKCIITDNPTQPKEKSKINRGKLNKNFGVK